MADVKEVDTLLENVEQFINDEHKIVTFEFLSQSCGIHVNLAKSVLEKYLEILKKKSDFKQYQIVYSLCGYIGKNLKFTLVRDAQLESAKAKLDKIISLHIYSIQKGKLESLDVLYNSSLTELKKSIQQCCGQSSITYKQVKLKPASELTSKIVSEVKKTSEPVKKLLNSETAVKKESAPALKTDSQSHSDGSKEQATKPLVKKPVDKPGIATMFAKQQAKEPTIKKAAIVEDSVKQATNKRVVRESSDEENENIDTNTEKVSNGKNKRLKLCEASVEKEDKLPKTSRATKTKPTKKKTQASNKTAGKTQRKRIQQISDSESSDGEEEEEDIILSSPEKLVPSVPMSDDDKDDEDFLNASVVEPGEKFKRSRKMVDENFMDEDGFMITKKTFKTCEEAIQPESSPKKKLDVQKSEPAASKPQDKGTTKQPSPPGKTKQKSITSFFTRK